MTKIEEWLEKDNLILLEGWARSGLTDEQIANNMGISRTTLWEWKKKEPDILNALKKGKRVVDFEVENALLKKALGYTIQIKEQKLDRDGCVHDLVKDVHIPPDTTAQIFWLKNRKKAEWREKVEYQDTSGIAKLDEILGEIKNNANK